MDKRQLVERFISENHLESKSDGHRVIDIMQREHTLNPPIEHKQDHWINIFGMCFGITSLVLWQLVIFAIIGITIYTISAFAKPKPTWRYWTGLACLVAAIVINIATYR